MIYLDNSATTYPKPLSVITAADNSVRRYSFNSGRGGYASSIRTAEMIFSARQKVAELVNASPENIIFTHNCTLALNMAVKGSVKRGDHIIISGLEHNAVSRCVYALSEQINVSYSVCDYSYDDDEMLNSLKQLIRPNTSLIVFTMASNVFGCIPPIAQIGALAHHNGIRFVVDGAQGVGVIDTDMRRDNIDILCGAGHKGLYATLSTGFMAIADGIRMNTIIEGGTGSSSLVLEQPEALPDRFEAGTLNNSGVIALGAGVDFVRGKGTDKIYSHELDIVRMVYTHLERDENAILYTPFPEKNKFAPIVSFNYKDYSSEKTSALLSKHGVAVRGGYHCAPLAHRSFGTTDRGTVRVSPSVFTTYKECEKFLNYLKKL